MEPCTPPDANPFTSNAWTAERIAVLLLTLFFCGILVWNAYQREDIYFSDVQYEVLEGSLVFEPLLDQGREGKTIQIHNVYYPKGFSVKANSLIRSRFIPQGYAFFSAEIGVDGTLEETRSASVIFRVLADGTLLYESPVLRSGMEPRLVRVPVHGRKEIELRVTDAGDGNEDDFAHWAMCRFEAR